MASVHTEILNRLEHINKNASKSQMLVFGSVFAVEWQGIGTQVSDGFRTTHDTVFHLLILTNLYHQRVVFKLIGVGDGELELKQARVLFI